MIRPKLVWLLALISVMAFFPAMAHASSWVVLNAAHEAVENLTAKLEGKIDGSDLALLTKELGIKFAITCTSLELIGVNLETAGTLTNGGKAKLTGCEAYGKGTLEESLGCHVHSAGQASGTVVSTEGKGEIIPPSSESELLVDIEPKTAGGSLVTFLTEHCSVPEVNPLHGKIYLRDGKGEPSVHAIEHLAEQDPLTSLYVGANNKEHLETSVDGSLLVFLGGEHKGSGWAASSLQLVKGPTWLILNGSGVASELKASLTGEIDSKDLTFLMHFAGLVLALTCTNFELIGMNLEAGGKLTEGSKVRFTGCEMYEKGLLEKPLNCHVHSSGQVNGTLETAQLKGELLLHTLPTGETEVLAKIEPQSETLVTIITEKCPILGEVSPIRGVVFFKDAEKFEESHLIKHLIEESSFSSLFIGTNTSEHLLNSVDGSSWVRLGGEHSGLKWAAMHN